MESLASPANQQTLPPELVPEPMELQRGGELTLPLLDQQGHQLQYNALTDGKETKAQLGVDLPVVMHFRVAGKDLALVDLRNKGRDPVDGTRHLDIFGMDANGHTTQSKHTTGWDADFLVVGKEWNGEGIYRRGDKGYLGIRPPAAGGSAANVVFGAGDGKCRDRFQLPAGMPQDAFHISYDGASLKITATEPITVTRMVEKTGDANQVAPVGHETHDALGAQVAATTEAEVLSAAGTDNSGEAVSNASEAAPVATELYLGDGAAASTEVPGTSVPQAQAELQTQPEVYKPTTAQIFESAESFVNILHHPNLDRSTYLQMLHLQDAWASVRAAAEADEFWRDRIRGNLVEASGAFDTLRYNGQELGAAITHIRTGLYFLTEAIANRNPQAVEEIRVNYHFGATLNQLHDMAQGLDRLGVDLAANRLRWDEAQADERYQDIVRYQNGEPNWHLEEMVAELRQSGDLLETATHYVDEQARVKYQWQARQRTLSIIARLAQRSQNGIYDVRVSPAVNAWRETVGDYEESGIGRLNAAQADEIRTMLAPALQELEDLYYLAGEAASAAQEA